MHYTAIKSGEAFAKAYGFAGAEVVDLGGLNVNGSLRGSFLNKQE